MDLREAGSSLDTLVSSFNARIMELQELVLARNMPSTSMLDLTAMDTTLIAMESQIQAIKNRLQEERKAHPAIAAPAKEVASHAREYAIWDARKRRVLSL